MNVTPCVLVETSQNVCRKTAVDQTRHFRVGLGRWESQQLNAVVLVVFPLLPKLPVTRSIRTLRSWPPRHAHIDLSIDSINILVCFPLQKM
jgi:hypothetical protein